MVTLLLYLVATVATAFAFAPWYFFLCRFFTGVRHRRRVRGDQLRDRRADPGPQPRPGRPRDQRQLLGRGGDRRRSAALLLLDTSIFDDGPRLAAGVRRRRLLGLGILLVRRHVPESPRWLFIHGREEEAERIVGQIEAEVRARDRPGAAEPRERASRSASATRSRSARSRRSRSSAIRAARSSAWRCSSARRSSTTPSPSTSARSSTSSST